MAITTKAAADLLNRYVFQKVWNEVGSEYHINIEMQLVSKLFQKGNFFVSLKQYQLPEGSWLVLRTHHKWFFGGLQIKFNEWICAEDIANQFDTLLSCYQRPGKLIPRSQIYVKRHRDGNVFIIVKQDPVTKVFDIRDLNPIYVTVYRDSDQPNKIVVKNWYAKPNDATSTVGLVDYILQCFAENKPGTFIYINGEEIDNDGDILWDEGDYIEVVLDRNVIGWYTVNVSQANTGYFSQKHNDYREIVHCPKAFNPNHKLITFNTCAMSARGVNTRKTRYFQTTDRRSVDQITHMDYSVSKFVVEAYRGYVDDEDVELLVRVRTHQNDNALMANLTYTGQLYICDDATILEHLRGNILPELNFWRADYLENSGYTKFMFDTPNIPSEESIAMHVDALGYYTVASILGWHTYKTDMSKDSAGSFVLKKPPALYGEHVAGKLFVEGVKVLNNDIRVIDSGYDECVLSFPQSVNVLNNKVLMNLSETGRVAVVTFVPSVNTISVDVPFYDAVVYLEHDLSEPVIVYKTTNTKVYEKLDLTPGTIDVVKTNTGSTLSFGMSLYGRKLLIRDKKFTWVKFINVNDDINDLNIISVSVETIDQNAQATPLLGGVTVDVYVNGKTLVKDVEFTYRHYVDQYGYLGYSEVFVSTLEHFLDPQSNDNIVEVIVSTETTVSTEVGYILKDKISYDKSATLWRDGLSIGTLIGDVLHNPIDTGIWFEPNIPVETGQMYQLQTTFSSEVSRLLRNYTGNLDIQRMSIINKYFGRFLEPDPAPIVVPHTEVKRLYSPLMHLLMKDIISGDLIVANDPYDKKFLAQFKQYQNIRDRDPTIVRVGNLIVDAFVSIAPSYYDFVAPTPEIYRIIHRLRDLILVNREEFGDVFDG